MTSGRLGAGSIFAWENAACRGGPGFAVWRQPVEPGELCDGDAVANADGVDGHLVPARRAMRIDPSEALRYGRRVLGSRGAGGGL